MEGKYVKVLVEGSEQLFIKCPSCQYPNHINAQKPSKVCECYACGYRFSEPDTRR
jgi:ribosomal protein S27E